MNMNGLLQLMIALLAAFMLCCGCSSGGAIILPTVDDGATVTSVLSSGMTPEDRFNSDPRFKGIINIGVEAQRAGAALQMPNFSYPHYLPPKFNRELHGWFTDPNKELDPLTFTCAIDDKTDLYANLKYMVEFLPYGGLKYHWQCKVPEEYGDFQNHLVDPQITAFDGQIYRFPGMPTIGHIGLPEIKFVVYPWRDLSVKPEKQVEDPRRMLVALNGIVWEDWEAAYTYNSNWSIEGIGNPTNVELGPNNVTVTLWLGKILTENAMLSLGPFSLEGKTVEDNYLVYAGGGSNPLGDDCDCAGLCAETLATHDYFEKEKNAWAYLVEEPPGCHIYWNYHVVVSEPLINDDATEDFWQHYDNSTFGDSVTDSTMQPWLPFQWGTNEELTTFIGGEANSDWLLVLGAGCGEGNPPWDGELFASFQNADAINPYFVEEPRIVSGPDAAAWMQSKLDIHMSNPELKAHPGPFAEQAIGWAQGDICGAYLLIDIYDGTRPGALGGFCIDVIDRWGNYSPQAQGAAALGGEIWIDHSPFYENELEGWPDPDHDPLSADEQFMFEECAIALNIDELLTSEPQHARVRVHDKYENWRRSGDFLVNPENQTYQVTKVGIIEQNYQGSTVLADFCSVPVADRPAGGYTLDYAAQVVVLSGFYPPFYVDSYVTSPTHEGSAGPTVIKVPLYCVDPESGRYEELDELFPDVGGDCNVYYYSRGSSLLIPPAQCHSVLVYDNNTSQEPDDEYDYLTLPRLYVSDEDNLLGVEGDFSDNNWKDFSIAVATDQLNMPVYSNALDDMYFGSSERGRFTGCSPDDGYKDNIYLDVLDCGVERVEVDVDGLLADIGIQSRGDAYFIVSHGNPASYTPPFNSANDLIDSIGPFDLPPGSPGGTSPYLTVTDWQASGLLVEVNWLISTACSLLNNGSWRHWRDGLVVPGYVSSICGFKELNIRSDLPNNSNDSSAFFGGFSQRLTNYDGATEEWWGWDCISDDAAIVAWMENARYWTQLAYHDPDIPGTMWPELDCAAVDGTYRYFLRKYWNWACPLAIIPQYYIVREQ